jgi:uncharacterized protein YndB with AHSA1/START domain
MARPFEVRKEIEVEASPEEVWEAIATGPGIDAWFMGSNQVEPREGGAVRMTLPGGTMESTVKVWDPPRRFVTETDRSEDGRFMAFEYLIEGRGGGTTVVRFVHSGFLPDDDWETEYEALKSGDPAYLQKLAEYLKYFRGRTAVPVSAYGPQVDKESAWAVFTDALGLTREVAEGDRVRATLEGLVPIEGVVDYVSPDFLGVRTSDAMYRFIHGMGTVVVGHPIYSDVDQQATERAWKSWIDRAFG